MSIQRYPAATAKLYDGFEDGFQAYTYVFRTPTTELSIQPVLAGRRFGELTSLLSSADLRQLLYEGNFQPVPEFRVAYTGTDRLALSYWRHERWLFIFASGESQPARYKIYLEGIWQLR